MWKSKFYGAFVLNHRVVLHAIDAAPARWRGDAGSSPLVIAEKRLGAPDTLVGFHTAKRPHLVCIHTALASDCFPSLINMLTRRIAR